MIAGPEEDAIPFARAVDFLLDGRADEARVELRKLSMIRVRKGTGQAVTERAPASAKSSLKESQRVAIYNRDGWRCRYCGRRVVVPGVIPLVGQLCPDVFAWESWNMPMKDGRTHPAAERLAPNIDHLHPVGLGGDWHDPSNLVAACTPCNEDKSDRLGHTPASAVLDGWDGVVSRYRPLFNLAAPPKPDFHLRWMRALGI